MAGRDGPLLLGVTDQLRHPGSQHRVRLEVALAGLATSVATVADGADVELDVVVEAMADGRLTATGTVRAPYEAECRRCLGPVTGVAEARLDEVFEPRPVDGETYPLKGEQIDLEPLARDAVLLALPVAPLCEAGCAGPDPDRHPVALPTDPGVRAGDAPPARDPRWAALDVLRPEE